MKDGDDDNPPKKNGRYKNHACSRILVGGEDHNVNKGGQRVTKAEKISHIPTYTPPPPPPPVTQRCNRS